jgi:serine/threonine protein kinase
MIKMTCPTCAKKLSIPEKLVGRTIPCPACSERFDVPSLVPVTMVPVNSPSTPSPVGETLNLRRASGPATPLPPTAGERTRPGLGEMGQLGPYRILNILGSGGMGVVYRGEDVQLQRSVALKVLLPTTGNYEHARLRFLREARSAAQLKHRHIVAIYGVGEDRGIPYLAMEYLEGCPLDVRLQIGPPMPLDDVLRIGAEVAEGLSAAHDSGVIHRDIKPANVWLETPGDRVKILDFSLARITSDSAELTQKGTIVGTPSYMPPEQARGEVVTFRADLFSLGCVLYRMTTGRSAFNNSDVYAALMSVCNDDPISPVKLVPDLPPVLNDLILQLLAKNPADRPATALEVARKLRSVGDGDSVPLPTIKLVPVEDPQTQEGPPDRPSAPQKRPKQSWLRPAIGGVAVSLVLLCVIVWCVILARPISQPTPEKEENVAPPPPVVEVKESKPFNGRDLSGLHVSGGQRDNWEVVPGEGIILTRGRDSGWLLTDVACSDFDLSLGYRLTPRAQAGIALRVPPDPDAVDAGIEMPLHDDRHYPLLPPRPDGPPPGEPGMPPWAGHPPPPRRDGPEQGKPPRPGIIFHIARPRVPFATKPGRWNQVEIHVTGKNVRISHNGQEIFNDSLDRFPRPLSPEQQTSGLVGLRSVNGKVEFRNITLKDRAK